MFGKRTAALIAVTALVGCSGDGTPDPAVAAIQHRFLLESEPSEALSLTAARETLPTSEEAVVIGQVDSDEPADDRRAMFVIREVLEDEGHGGTGHDAANCPFCKRRRANAPVAVVQFLDDDGEILKHSPQELFGLRANDVVLIRGRLELDQLGVLSVNAQEIFVRR